MIKDLRDGLRLDKPYRQTPSMRRKWWSNGSPRREAPFASASENPGTNIRTTKPGKHMNVTWPAGSDYHDRDAVGLQVGNEREGGGGMLGGVDVEGKNVVGDSDRECVSAARCLPDRNPAVCFVLAVDEKGGGTGSRNDQGQSLNLVESWLGTPGHGDLRLAPAPMSIFTTRL